MAVQPPQKSYAGDFDMIEDAVMETVRGRWFLSEYARRLRAEDRDHVLAAVTRLEARLCAPAQAPWHDAEQLAQSADQIARILRICYYALREGEKSEEVSRDLYRQVDALTDLARQIRRPYASEQAPICSPPSQQQMSHAPTHAPTLAVAPQPEARPVPAPPVPAPPAHTSQPAPSSLARHRHDAFAALHHMPARQRAAAFG
jgi:hypothetical protein